MWNRSYLKTQAYSFPVSGPYGLNDHGGKSSKWEAQRIISIRNGKISGNVKCTKQKKIEQQENTCPSFCPFLLWKSIRKRKQGNKKKRVKQRGSQTIFYSMTLLNKNIVHRSKVHLCTAVVWKRRHIYLKTGRYVLSVTMRAPYLYCGYFKGLFCKVVNASAIPALAYKRNHLPIIRDPLVIPSFIQWTTSSCKVAGC